jgi:hypothetical protein
MMKTKTLIALIGIITSTSLHAETWATGTCTAWTGEIVKYAVHQGRGFISYDNGKPQAIFTKFDGKYVVITQVGAQANVNFAIDPYTGRGYAYAKNDQGQVTEGNITCVLSSVEK